MDRQSRFNNNMGEYSNFMLGDREIGKGQYDQLQNIALLSQLGIDDRQLAPMLVETMMPTPKSPFEQYMDQMFSGMGQGMMAGGQYGDVQGADAYQGGMPNLEDVEIETNTSARNPAAGKMQQREDFKNRGITQIAQGILGEFSPVGGYKDAAAAAGAGFSLLGGDPQNALNVLQKRHEERIENVLPEKYAGGLNRLATEGGQKSSKQIGDWLYKNYGY